MTNDHLEQQPGRESVYHPNSAFLEDKAIEHISLSIREKVELMLTHGFNKWEGTIDHGGYSVKVSLDMKT